MTEIMNSLPKTARVAGLLYLAIVITGLFNLIYVPSKLIVRGNATETAANILAHQTLYRVDVAVSLVSIIIFLFLVLALYRLLKDVNQQLAAIMVILVMVQIPQGFVSQVLQLGALELSRGAGFLSAIDKGQRDVLAMLCLRLNDQATYLSEMFWGIWLLPLGLLVYRSSFLPRTLGVWLIVNCCAYVALSFTGLLFPDQVGVMSLITLPALLGEMAFTLWLVFVGVRARPATTAA